MEIFIDNIPLTDLGAYADVSYSENLRGGCDVATWGMGVRFRHTRIHTGCKAQVREGPINLFTGVLSQPAADGTMTARGWSTLGSGVLALDGSSAPTNDSNVATVAARGRGAVPWGQPATMGAALGDVEATMALNALLDRYSDANLVDWRVDHNGNAEMRAKDTTPKWAVQIAENDLWTFASNNYVTHLNVTYFTTGLVTTQFVATTPDSAAAAAKWGRVEKTLDLTGEGILTAPQANAWAQTILSRTGPKMQMMETITVGPGQLRTLGDVPAGWASVHPGQMVRLWGVPDRSKPIPTLHTDVVIGRIERNRSTLTMAPVGAIVQSFEDVIAELFAAVS